MLPGSVRLVRVGCGPASTKTPITLLHALLSPGSRLTLPWRKDFNALAYVLSGRGSVGTDRQPIDSGQLAVFDGFGTVPRLGTIPAHA
ncbi:pirin-like C-terminal cupin domain-containing protein [Streptosporangium subroseum]|uniref:pirin-like C-terminal cupin domain-containing protein n=1 Tax=Streptosporangium subroseum TaxID=106412 RepID=UPI00343E529E